ncbi:MULTISPECIES: HAAS domain-containing protein [Sporosarcina]|uniref:HAAS domain-containing protein n=1 Tax=Sporosarcina contaminans TaxID=633403 RepID=A0ABW3TXW0_9BACL
MKNINYFALFGVIFFNLVLFSGVAIAVAGLLFSLWTIVVSFAVSPILLLLSNVIGLQPFSVLQTVFSVVLLFIGMALLPLAVKATRYLGALFMKYVEYNKKAIYKVPDANAI